MPGLKWTVSHVVSGVSPRIIFLLKVLFDALLGHTDTADHITHKPSRWHASDNINYRGGDCMIFTQLG